MVINHLCDLLLALCGAATAEFRLRTPKGDVLMAPRVFDGFVPRKRSEEGEDFPFILVRPSGGSVEETESSIRVKILIGCTAPDDNGYRYVLNVFERVKNALATQPDNMLDRRFMLQAPLQWELSDEQPWPAWLLSVNTSWRTRTPDLQMSNTPAVLGYFEEKEYAE